MGDFVEGLLKIHNYGVSHVTLTNSTYQAMICGTQLGLARQSSSKTVLAVMEYIVQDFIEVMYYNMFHHFAWDTCE